MQVLQLTERFPPAIGGVESHVQGLAFALLRAGVHVQVATTDLRRSLPFERLPRHMEGFPFPVRRHRAIRLAELPHGLGIVSPAMLLDALDGSADVLHAHAYGHFPSWAAALAETLDGSTLVVTPHSDAGQPSFSKSVFDGIVPLFTLRRAARVIALTGHEASRLADLGIDKDRIAVIPNGVDLAEFADLPPLRGRNPPTTGLFVGRLDLSQKGLEPLVQSLANLPRSSDFHLRIVGEDWGAADRIRRLAKRLGVEDRLSLVGPVDRPELVREYAQADLLVLPSVFEPFGIVLLEAMAAGLPVIASRVGGIPEVVEEGVTGLLVEPSDPESLAAAIVRLVESPDLRARLGVRGRDRARAYAWAVLAPRILDVYRDAIQERA